LGLTPAKRPPSPLVENQGAIPMIPPAICCRVWAAWRFLRSIGEFKVLMGDQLLSYTDGFCSEESPR
jgi:hypothetical protein